MKKIILISTFISLFSILTFAKEVVLDVRTPAEFSQDHTKTAINVDVSNSNFNSIISAYEKTDSYRIYCRSGKRASKAVEIMKGLGFTQLENLGSLENAKKVLGE